MDILDDDGQRQSKKINPKDRITPSFLTKYERARVIGKKLMKIKANFVGTRALQISKNAPIMIDIDQSKK